VRIGAASAPFFPPTAFHADGAAARAECVLRAPAGRSFKSRAKRKNDCRADRYGLDLARVWIGFS
jgi:hypothetical protein